MKKISIICCYTNEEQLECLKNSVTGYNNAEIEWVSIDNRDNKYTSAAAALNHGADIARGDIFFFIHQDVEFVDFETIDRIIRYATEGKVVGVAGKDFTGEFYSNIYHGEHKEIFDMMPTDVEYVEVMCCDECLIAMSREVYKILRGFDEIHFDGWHFYGVDICVDAVLRGIGVVVVRSGFWHKSEGTKDKVWLKYQDVISKKYRKTKLKALYYPCGWCYTGPIKYQMLLMFRRLKKILGKREDIY